MAQWSQPTAVSISILPGPQKISLESVVTADFTVLPGGGDGARDQDG